jgi:RNA-binding protein YhbY
MKKGIPVFQIGKRGLSDDLIGTIKSAFAKRENVKVTLLKSAGHTKEKTKEAAERIVDKLGKNFTYRIIGFTIVIKKWRKPKR